MGKVLEAAKRQYDVLHSRDIEALVNLYSERCEVIAMGANVHGRDQLRGFTANMLNAFPDLNHEIKEVIEEGDRALVLVDITGTHTGTLQGPAGALPPSGRTFRVPAAQVYRVEDGRIMSMRSISDRLDLLQQLGALPVPAQA